MQYHLTEAGLGYFKAEKQEIYIVIKHHAEERLEERLPQLSLQDVCDDLDAAVPALVDGNGLLQLGSYLIVNETSGLMIPLVIEKNKRAGYAEQTIGVITTIMDYRARYRYSNNVLDKYDHSKTVYLSSEEEEQVLNESFRGSYKLILV
jgi:hypothetical protein